MRKVNYITLQQRPRERIRRPKIGLSGLARVADEQNAPGGIMGTSAPEPTHIWIGSWNADADVVKRAVRWRFHFVPYNDEVGTTGGCFEGRPT